MKLNNRGMTLVEMVVAFAILGIVSTSIFSMLLTGTKTYAKLTETVKLQHQVQVTTANIERRILNCNEGLTYTADVNDRDILFIIDSKCKEDGSVQKDLQVVYLDKISGELYLATLSDVRDEMVQLEFNLLAENVKAMKVEYDSSNERIDRTSLKLVFGKKDLNGNEIEQILEKSITLRNHPSSKYICTLSNETNVQIGLGE